MGLPLIIFSLLLLAIVSSQSMALDIYVPDKCKTEGRVTLIQPDTISNHQIIKHHLPFTETLDLKGRRSTISIGYVSYAPVKYFARSGSPLLTVDSNGKCISHDDQFVSTLSWFIKEMFPSIDLSSISDPILVGPTSLIDLIRVLTKDMKVTHQRETVHRNIPCTVFEYQKVIATDITLVAEFYVPTDVMFNSLRTTFFSAKASTYNTADASKLSTANMLRATYIVDYYFIDDASTDPEKFDRLMRSDFNVPLAAGCSRYLKSLSPDVSKQSFSMSYKQVSTISSHMLAYDHSSGLLRKERIGESVSVWDLKEDLLYHVDVDLARSLENLNNVKTDVRACSVLKVTDTKLGPAFRPYEKVYEPIDVLKLIGASSVSYMGTGSVRDLPCSIYETILDEPPAIFGLTAEQLQRKSSIGRKYIVQFYLLETDRSTTKSANDDHYERLPTTGFWPAQINLYRQFSETGNVELIDQLEVYDFFWSLDGWTKKNNELFMAGECFDDANKQVRLEMALTFDGQSAPETSKSVDRAADLSQLLPYNKFKLEYDLIDDIFRNVFDVSKMHLVSYELKLRPSHLGMRMLIADRSHDMELVYFGEGELLDDKAYAENRISLAAQTEESCISMSSLIGEISMTIYCPFCASRDASCTAVYDQPEPVFKNSISTDPLVPTCHVYRFKPAPLPKQALANVLERKQQLYKRPFNFKARVNGVRGDKPIELAGQIRDYELTHNIQLITLAHHAFVLPDHEQHHEGDEPKTQVRSFESIDYRTPNDCERICNLDTNCRSYSYCRADKKCHLSSLDIRQADLQAKLVRIEPVENELGQMVASVHDAQGKHEYKIVGEENCFIYERNYLSYYKQTEEIISLDRKLAKQFPIAPSTFYCAKMSIDIEASHSEHHVAMFAYCESTNVCIMDENLFKPTGANDSASNGLDGPAYDEYDEMTCRIYRKKYQTYFSISSRVLKPEPEQQLDFKLNTVEECARACWIRFGRVCASFDFCIPGSCTINKLSTLVSAGGGGGGGGVDDKRLEMRSGCLHYERDLELDKLREQHMIGRHQILDRSSLNQQVDAHNHVGQYVVNLLTYVLAFGAFIYGLALGRKVNDKMEAVTVSRQSVSAAANQAAATSFDYQSFPLDDEGAPTDIGRHRTIGGGSDVIKMDVINRTSNGKSSHNDQ